MTVTGFRRLVLSMPEAVEGEHQGHPDFRVCKKIFATLFERDGETWGMLKLTPQQQADFVATSPMIFSPLSGGWGRRGCTRVFLPAVDRASAPILRNAIFTAWCNSAPRRLPAEQGPARKARHP